MTKLLQVFLQIEKATISRILLRIFVIPFATVIYIVQLEYILIQIAERSLLAIGQHSQMLQIS